MDDLTLHAGKAPYVIGSQWIMLFTNRANPAMRSFK